MHELHYYIFKFKKLALGKWLFGICGGYEDDELENCGHVYSEMEEYHKETAVEQATALIEYVRECVNKGKAGRKHGKTNQLLDGLFYSGFIQSR